VVDEPYRVQAKVEVMRFFAIASIFNNNKHLLTQDLQNVYETLESPINSVARKPLVGARQITEMK
jgi:hypothetical protein